MKKWCKHIKWIVQWNRWEYKHRSLDSYWVLTFPKNWKICPICGAKHPSTTNKRKRK